tara:strand:+ start:64 stop:252 length:189 start_codon:yes stop_codon:yes gene_type:complete
MKITYQASYADTEDNYKGIPDWLRAQRKSWHGSERIFTDGDNRINELLEQTNGQRRPTCSKK